MYMLKFKNIIFIFWIPRDILNIFFKIQFHLYLLKTTFQLIVFTKVTVLKNTSDISTYPFESSQLILSRIHPQNKLIFLVAVHFKFVLESLARPF